MRSDLSHWLEIVCQKMKVKFTYNGRNISYEEVFSATGLLPALAKRADQLSSLCLGYGIGVMFEDAEKALLGNEVKFDEATPTAIRLACFVDVIYELINASSNKSLVSLDDLMYE